MQALRVVQANTKLRNLLETAEIDSTDTVLAMSETDPEAFRRGIELLLLKKPSPAEGWPAQVHEVAEQLDYLFAIVVATASRWQEEKEADLRRSLHTVQGFTRGSRQPVALRNPRQPSRPNRSRTPTAGRRGLTPTDSAGGPSLRAQEVALKAKWVQKLLAIHNRAGPVAMAKLELKEAAELTGAQIGDMLEAVLGRGAWRTIRNHVLTWVAFEKWTAPLLPYPPSHSMVLGYAAHRASKGCGPCVIPSFRATVGWICRRLSMEAPNCASESILAIEESTRKHSRYHRRRCGALKWPLSIGKQKARWTRRSEDGGPFVWCGHPCDSTMHSTSDQTHSIASLAHYSARLGRLKWSAGERAPNSRYAMCP